MMNSSNIVYLWFQRESKKGTGQKKIIEDMTENIPNLLNEIKPQILEAVGIE